jgi:hypothetical protein
MQPPPFRAQQAPVLDCLKAPEAFVKAEPAELAASILMLKWGGPGAAFDEFASVSTLCTDLLLRWGILGGPESARFDVFFNNAPKFGWLYEPLVEGALHLQSRLMCLVVSHGNATHLAKTTSLIYLLRRGREALQSGDVMRCLR